MNLSEIQTGDSITTQTGETGVVAGRPFSILRRYDSIPVTFPAADNHTVQFAIQLSVIERVRRHGEIIYNRSEMPTQKRLF